MKYIKITDEVKNIMLQEAASKLDESFTDKLTIVVPDPPKDTPKPILVFKEDVWRKMQLYIETTSTEIGWEGIVERDGLKFTVTDVFLFPQTVSAAFVDVGVDEYNYYNKWSDELPRDSFNSKRFHGHSHVNMNVNPSGTDSAGEKTRVDDLLDGDFYIFMIANKSGKIRVAIYDKETNIHYENEDINLVRQISTMMQQIETEKSKFIIEDQKNKLYIKGPIAELNRLGIMFTLETITVANEEIEVAVLEKGLSQYQKKSIEESETSEFVKPDPIKTYSGYNSYNGGFNTGYSNNYNPNSYDNGSYYSSHNQRKQHDEKKEVYEALFPDKANITSTNNDRKKIKL